MLGIGKKFGTGGAHQADSQGGEDDPEGELRQRGEGDGDDLADQELQRADGGNDDLDDARVFLFTDAAHDLHAENNERQHHKRRQYHSENGLDAGETLAAGDGIVGMEAYVGRLDRMVDGRFKVVDTLDDGVAEEHLQLAVDEALQGQRGGGGAVVEEGVAGDGELAHGDEEDGGDAVGGVHGAPCIVEGRHAPERDLGGGP